MREQYKYRVFNRIRERGWVVDPVAGSGGGRKGEHRPDALAANGRRRVVMELKKRSRLPV